jgi:hypothetical protein
VINTQLNEHPADRMRRSRVNAEKRSLASGSNWPATSNGADRFAMLPRFPSERNADIARPNARFGMHRRPGLELRSADPNSTTRPIPAVPIRPLPGELNLPFLKRPIPKAKFPLK